jgi:phosphoglycolate phosphatase
MRPDAVVFDLDGTLADTAADIQQALNRVLADEQLPSVDVDTVRLMIGRGPEVLVSRVLENLDTLAAPDRVARMTDAFRENYSEQGNNLSCLFPGTTECLEELARQRIAIGLCSNKPESNCTQLLDDLGIRGHFAAIQGSGAGLPLKPDPEPLVATVHRLGATRPLYVGDSATDVATARAASIPVALVRGGYTQTPPEALAADWVLERLSDLPSIWQSR